LVDRKRCTLGASQYRDPDVGTLLASGHAMKYPKGGKRGVCDLATYGRQTYENKDQQ
jgi:hypothetical protein